MSTAQGSGSSRSGAPGTADVAKDQASSVAQSAGGAASHVAQQSKEQAGEVAAEAQRQARDLLGEARTQVSAQAGVQRDRIAEALMALGSELEEMADKGGQGGIASEFARQASQRVVSVAGQIEGREPGDLLGDLRSYAGRRPTAFLVGALAAGVLAGRLTRGIRDEASDSAPAPARALPPPRPAVRPAAPALSAPAAPIATPPGAGRAGTDIPARAGTDIPARDELGRAARRGV